MSQRYAYFPKTLSLAEIGIALRAIYQLITNNNTEIEGKVEEAPEDGVVYGRQDAAWVPVTEEAPADGNRYVRKDEAWFILPETVSAPVTTVTNDYSVVAADDYTIIIDASSNTVTVTMPAAPPTDQVWNIACLDSTFTADIDWNGKSFYDDTSNQVLFKGENLTVQYDGTQYVGA